MRNVIRAAPIFLDGKKVAEASDGSYDIESGDERQIATDGYFGHSDGATVTNISFNCIIPVKGMQITVDQILLNKKYIQFGVPINGHIHQVDGRLISGNYSWDHKNGRCMGAFKVEGGAPDLTG